MCLKTNDSIIKIITLAVRRFIEYSKDCNSIAYFSLMGNIYKLKIKVGKNTNFNPAVLDGSHEKYITNAIEQFIMEMNFRNTLELDFNCFSGYTSHIQFKIEAFNEDEMIVIDSEVPYEDAMKERILSVVEKLCQKYYIASMYNITQLTRFIQSSQLRLKFLDELVEEGKLTFEYDYPNGRRTRTYKLPVVVKEA